MYPLELEYAEKKKQGFILLTHIRLEVLYMQKGRCYICHVEEWATKKRLQAHRIIGRKEGGKYTLENTILVCCKDHRRLEGKTREEINLLVEDKDDRY